MNTVITHISWVDGFDCHGASYYERTRKWLDYYRGIKKEIGWTDIILLENGSRWESLQDLGCTMRDEDLVPMRHELHDQHAVWFPNLKRGDAFDYPYVWRAVFFIRKLFQYYDKVLVIDNDSFILSRKLADFVRDCNSGWRALWCPRYGFPECNLQVICRDAFPLYESFTEGDYNRMNGHCMETTLPLTHVHKEFVADRFGEDGTEQKPGMDFYSQCRLSTPMRFER